MKHELFTVCRETARCSVNPSTLAASPRASLSNWAKNVDSGAANNWPCFESSDWAPSNWLDSKIKELYQTNSCVWELAHKKY